MENKPIKLTIKLSGGKGSIIPHGVVENLRVEIIDEWAFYHFDDVKTTKKFVESQKKDGVYTTYHPLKKKAICNYSGMNQKAIAKHITTRLNELSKKNE